MNKNAVKIIAEKIKADKRIAIIVVLGMIGILLLTLSEIVPEKDKDEQKNETVSAYENYEEEIEKRLTETVSAINGAGRTKVMITLESGDENVYAVENKHGEKSSESQYVIVENGGDDKGLLLKVVEPEVRGVAVVCEGADSAKVRQEIVDTVTAVLGISTNRVSIAKISNGG